MSIEASGFDDQSLAVPWEPRQLLRECDHGEIHFSRGLLRSRPERWFPGFAAFWLPLAHSLGVEVQLVEVKPILLYPPSLEYGYGAHVDGEPVGILFDSASARVIADAVAPGCDGHAEKVVLEYMVRRFIYSAACAWSAAESSRIEFDGSIDPFQQSAAASVKLTVMVNNNYCTVWTTLGKRLAERLDGLWRRQVHAQAKSENSQGTVHVEIAQLSVAPTMFVEYARPGAVIDLEIPVSDQLTLRLDGKSWMPVRMAANQAAFVFESLPGPAVQLEIPEGTTRLSIELGSFSIDAHAISELSQPGAIFQSELELTNRVAIVAQEKKIASGTLCAFEGRFAVVIDSEEN